jgi:hypothetical protein
MPKTLSKPIAVEIKSIEFNFEVDVVYSVSEGASLVEDMLLISDDEIILKRVYCTDKGCYLNPKIHRNIFNFLSTYINEEIPDDFSDLYDEGLDDYDYFLEED